MRIHPTIVIGLGSTGKFAIANIEKYLYEVLSAEQLDLFRFIVLETAPDSGADDGSAPGSRTRPVDIKPTDIGAAWRGLKMALKDEFNWCPERLNIGNQQPGAGNMRAGGRLMFVASMETINKVVVQAVIDVKAAAQNIQVKDQLEKLMKARGLDLPSGSITVEPTFLVIGTLAGGTCSGACVDLAYLLSRIQPTAIREAVFVFPDDSAIPVYQENSWAALQDILYFTENRKAYHVEWLSSAQTRVSFSTEQKPEPPYSHVYLVTQKNMHGSLDLAYSASPTSPLLKMVGLFATANLLGLQDLRQTRLVDLNTRVDSTEHQVFLTNTLRGVSYPKYELSEAAASRVVANICEAWLSGDAYIVNGSPQHLQKEETRQRGRNTWNQQAPPTWKGLRDSVDIPDLSRRIVDGEIADVAAELLRTFSDQSGNGRSIYSQVAQNVNARDSILKQDLRKEFAGVLQQVQNVRYGEWYLEGLQAEIKRTHDFWGRLGVPHGSNDLAAWRTSVRSMVEDLVDRSTAIGIKTLQEKRSLVADELGEILARLEMFLMFKKLEDLSDWLRDDLQARLERVRKVLSDVKAIAHTRAEVIERELNDQSGPLLKISRSADRRFKDEIADLVKAQPSIQGSDFVRFTEGDFEGLLPLKAKMPSGGEHALFNALRTRVQPALMERLQHDGPIDIVREIQRQGFTPSAVQRATATEGLSIATTQPLMVGQENVPAYVLAGSADTGSALLKLMREATLAVPALSPQSLPLLDHMALFYQEGGKLGPDVMRDAQSFRLAYEAAMKTNKKEVLDPLGHLKTTASASGAGVPASSSTPARN